ncbi:hypothetical protein C1646_776704, partial [Rhizophagus diaphanus]
NLRRQRQNEQAAAIPSVEEISHSVDDPPTNSQANSVEENDISPSYHINNEPPCHSVDDPPTYSQAIVDRVVLSQNVGSQFTEFRCLRGHFHIDQEDLDGCYKKFITKYGNNVDKFMEIYSCNRLEAENYILKYNF